MKAMPGSKAELEETACVVAQAAVEEQQRLQEAKVLGPGVGVGLLHGRMDASDKAAALQAFADGRTPVLIATSVVEVTTPPPMCSSAVRS